MITYILWMIFCYLEPRVLNWGQNFLAMGWKKLKVKTKLNSLYRFTDWLKKKKDIFQILLKKIILGIYLLWHKQPCKTNVQCFTHFKILLKQRLYFFRRWILTIIMLANNYGKYFSKTSSLYFSKIKLVKFDRYCISANSFHPWIVSSLE